MKKNQSHLVWILGQGGLLGSSLENRIKEHPSQFALWPREQIQFDWRSLDKVQHQFKKAIELFSQAAQNSDVTTVIWAAGSGVIGTETSQLTEETQIFSLFLDSLHSYYQSNFKPANFFFASTAGAIWAGSQSFPIDEDTPPHPISNYGRQKLIQESLLIKFGETLPHLKILIGRISNLYGPGQKLNKSQGLLSQLCRSSLLQSPVDIFVPLDTVRDYIQSEDCAELIFRALSKLTQTTHHPRTVIKIFASEEPTSIHQILSWLKNLTHKEPRVTFPEKPLSREHPKVLSFRSKIWVDSFSCMPLIEGLHQMLNSQEAQLQMGQLNFPD